MTAAVDVKALARAERADLADLLSGLTPAQWDAPSLCAGWRVRDVVAHMFSYDALGPLGLVRRFVTGGLHLDRVNAAGVAGSAGHSTDELLTLARGRPHPRGLIRAFGGRIALTDALVHHQDIRRPLGLPRHVPADRLLVVLPFACFAPPIGAATRIRGLRLVATDLDWATGDGPVVEGPAEALLLAIAGRPGITPDLAGPGLPTLAGRIGS